MTLLQIFRASGSSFIHTDRIDNLKMDTNDPRRRIRVHYLTGGRRSWAHTRPIDLLNAGLPLPRSSFGPMVEWVLDRVTHNLSPETRYDEEAFAFARWQVGKIVYDAIMRRDPRLVQW